MGEDGLFYMKKVIFILVTLRMNKKTLQCQSTYQIIFRQ